MASRPVLVIHRADQDEYDLLAEHQEKHECGCGWWDYTHRKDGDPVRQPFDAPPASEYRILCLPDGQLIFQSDDWSEQQWRSLLVLLGTVYPAYLMSVVWCHS